MSQTIHVITGGIIGAATGNPIVAFILGNASHFLLDKIPHGDSKIGEHNKKRIFLYIAADIMILAAILFLMRQRREFGFSFWVGALGGVMPDLVNFNIIYPKAWMDRYCKWHNKFHVSRKNDFSFFSGHLLQIVLIFLMVIIGLEILPHSSYG